MARLFTSTHYLEDPASTFYLANAYEKGLGVDPDINYAIRVYRQALYLGHEEAKTRLEHCLDIKQREEAELDSESESESEAKSEASESENTSPFGDKRHRDFDEDSDEDSAPDSESENDIIPKSEVEKPR